MNTKSAKYVRRLAGLKWEHKRRTGTRVVERIDGENHNPVRYTSRRTEAAFTTVSVYVDDYTVEIDIEEIISEVVGKAMHNRTGRARLMNGNVVAKRTKRETISEYVTPIALSEGHRIVSEQPKEIVS